MCVVVLAYCRRTQLTCGNRVPFNGLQPASSPSSTAGYFFLAQATDLDACPGTCIRPVGLAFADDGRLFVSSDSSGELFVISAEN